MTSNYCETMSVRSAGDLTVMELKEKLRQLALPCSGSKNELVLRLNESVPSGAWFETEPEMQATRSAEESVGRRTSEANFHGDEMQPEDRYRDMRILEMELATLRRELELLKMHSRPSVPVSEEARIDTESRSMQPRINMSAIAELLTTFDGTTGNFETWERQLKLLKQTYRLDDEHARVLIGMRLKGKALEWLHSKPEFMEMSVEALLCELKTMFNHRPSKIVSRKKFEERVWRKEETFSDYVHQKVILGNRISIDEGELAEYIIDGIPDRTLRDQARISGLDTKAALLEAFERITLLDKRHHGMKNEDRSQSRPKGNENKKNEQQKTSPEKKHCFNCGLPDHLGRDCPTKESGPKCFKCGERGHIAAKCSKKSTEVKASYVVSQVNQTKCNKEVIVNGHHIVALIDTGSDLCLMREDQYNDLGSPSLKHKETRFRGIGLRENVALGEFCAELTVDEHVYPVLIRVVANDVISYKFLIGVDFLNKVELRVRNGNVLISPVEETVAQDSELPEIFQIDFACDGTNEEKNMVHVSNDKHRLVIESMVSNYCPVKIRETSVKMSIILKDEEPVYQRARRLSPIEREKVNTHINEWIRDGIARPSLSDYASPVVLVHKKDGNTRLCVDFRQLNKKIVRDRYPLPLIEDQLDMLQNAKYFSTLDLRNGFFHVPIDAESQKYTAFIVPDGHYEFLKVPFGLCNSPSVFQRFINVIFREAIRDKIVLIYLDDLIIPSTDEDVGIKHLEIVLKIASEAGLDINWKKCQFLRNRIEFLGYIVEDGKVYPSARKIDAVSKFPEPVNFRQVQSFLGLSGYFRKFIPNYSIIARPLTNLLKQNTTFQFREEERGAFICLKTILCNKPVLRLYRVNAVTELHTDASIDGYGAILLQKSDEDSAFHPIYYSSSKTTPAERRYTSYELEVLAIIKALTKFRVYLLGIPFKVVTDCRAFALTMQKKDLCVRVARWALLLEEFNYVIEHRPGKSMVHVDSLSRNPIPICMIADDCDNLTVKFKRAQQADDDIRKMYDTVKKGKNDNFVIKNDLLFKRHDGDNLLVVPRAIQTQIIKQAHDRGHFSVAKTEALLRRDYYMPNVRPKIEKVISNCVVCILAEKKHGKQEGYLNMIEKGELPLDTYHIDHLGPLPSTKKNYKYIFAVVDAFTKFVWLYATRTTNAVEVIDKLKKQSFIFGNPRRIISDRGAAFTSKDFTDYCTTENIKHVLITTGVPRANGQIERVNRVLISLLTKLSDPKKEEWFKFLNVAQLYLNCASHRSIGTTPFHLFFGIHARVREDPQIRELLHEEWVNDFQNNRDELRRQAKECISKIQRENRICSAKRRKAARKYNENDLVAIKRTQLGPGLKLANKYFGPYSVIKVLRKDRYIVQKIGEHEGPSKTSTSADHMKPWVNFDSDISDEECETEDIRGRMSLQDDRV